MKADLLLEDNNQINEDQEINKGDVSKKSIFSLLNLLIVIANISIFALYYYIYSKKENKEIEPGLVKKFHLLQNILFIILMKI